MVKTLVWMVSVNLHALTLVRVRIMSAGTRLFVEPHRIAELARQARPAMAADNA